MVAGKVEWWRGRTNWNRRYVQARLEVIGFLGVHGLAVIHALRRLRAVFLGGVLSQPSQDSCYALCKRCSSARIDRNITLQFDSLCSLKRIAQDPCILGHDFAIVTCANHESRREFRQFVHHPILVTFAIRA